MNLFYRIVIYPLELILEFFFSFFDKSFNNLGIAIIGVGFVVSFLTLPLYHVAESLQKKERDHRNSLASGIERIKNTFRGDEQYMMLSTFYRQNNYHPLFALRSSVSLAIQVPFFIAAYHFLSNLEQLRGYSFLGIPDLGAPDGMLSICGSALNALPILMTVINILAGIVYTKGFPRRDKIQLYGMAGLFLILLYNSPAGLVLYWTLNNIFSFLKNIFYKIKYPLQTLYGLSVFGIIGVSVGVYSLHPLISISDRMVLVASCAFVIAIPVELRIFRILDSRLFHQFSEKSSTRSLVLVLSLTLLFLIHGILVPANLIASSTIEFSFTGIVSNPLSYIIDNAILFFGLWIVWPLFVYLLTKGIVRNFFVLSVALIAFTAIVNLVVFPGSYGIISPLLQLDNPALLETSLLMTVLPLGITLIIVIIVLLVMAGRKVHLIISTLILLIAGAVISSGYQIAVIKRDYQEYDRNLAMTRDGFSQTTVLYPEFQLSKTGNNVLFIFLDRAMSSFFPFIIEDLPDLRQQLDGFIYYPNTVSFGASTLFGAPAMMGGYEYVPDALDKRTTETLVDKHNEALLVMPRLLAEAGFSVTVTNPPFSNYKWDADFSPFDPYPEVRVLNHLNKFNVSYFSEYSDVLNWDPRYESNLIQKRLPVFSILRTSFPLLRRTLYERGNYFQQAEHSIVIDSFLSSYAQLYYLSDLTECIDNGNSFVLISNDTTHKPTVLQSPEYEPRSIVTDSSTPLDGVDGVGGYDQTHYQINAASLKQLGRYFDFLREQGVYDNTRIVIIADHGADLYSEGMSDFSQNARIYNGYVPLFLTKDFKANGPVETDKRFMTNADAPLFAIEGLVDPINPFTGNNLFDQVMKDVVNVYSGPWDPRNQKGNTYVYDRATSFSVKEDIFIEENWAPLLNRK